MGPLAIRLRPRGWLRTAAGAAALTVLLAVGTAAWLLRDPTPRFAERRSRLVATEEGTAVHDAGHVSRSVRLRAASGLSVELLVRHPEGPGDGRAGRGLANAGGGREGDGGRPLFLILGGYRTGERAATLLEDTGGAVVAAVGYPYDGPLEVRGLEVVRHVPRIRRALLDTPPAVQLALDYLLTRGDVDPARVELVGVSFGAPFAAVAAALDERVSRLWLVHGGGRPFTLLEHNLRRAVPMGLLRVPVAAAANVLAAGPRLAPERWLPLVAPRPVVLINALDDERLPREAVEALYASALPPKEHIWLPGPHVQSNREDVIRSLVDVVLSRAAGEPVRF